MLQIEIFLISIVAIIVILLLGRYSAQKLSTPLKMLAKTATQIAQGDFRQDVSENRSIREIGDLARAFSTMQEGLAEREARILYQSSHDMMTHLFNRQHALDVLAARLQDSGRQPLLVVVINVLRFREINESFGHSVGDQCLALVAQRLSANSQKLFVARLAGDEFLAVIPKDEQEGTVLEQLERELHAPYQIDALSIALRFCFGVANSSTDGETANQLLQRATIALDRARLDQQSLVFYNKDLEEEHRARIMLLNDLKSALQGQADQLHVYYQPKLGFTDSNEYRFEALLRWIHPEKGFVSPEYFIPLAEQAGLVTQITDWVVKQVVMQVAQWRGQQIEASVAINLSAKDLTRPLILDDVSQLLSRYQLPKSALSFEITESDVMGDTKAAIALLNRFREQGFDLAIDDFGTGYSSLSQLKNMPVTELKIDKSFVLNLDSSVDDQIIVRSTIMLAREFNLKVVAEGVENQASLDLLRDWGCDWIQGFYLSRPLPVKDIDQWVAEQPASLVNAN